MLETIIGAVFSTGSFLAFLWFGRRTLRTQRAHASIAAADRDSSALVDGTDATVVGDVVVDESANAGVHGGTVVESASLAVLVWRVRLGQQETGGWTTVETGIETGEFRIDTGTETVRVDATRLDDRDDGPDLWSLTADDLNEHGLKDSLEAKTGSVSPYVDVSTYEETFTLDEKRLLSPEVHDELGSSQRRYRVELAALPEDAPLAAFGRIAVEGGDTVIRGADDAPLTVSDRGPDGLERRVRAQTMKTGVYAVGSLIAAAGFLFLTVSSSPI